MTAGACFLTGRAWSGGLAVQRDMRRGADVADGVWSVLLAVGLAVAAIVLWGILAAPKSPRRLTSAWRIPFELCFFALAFAGRLAVGLRVTATFFGVAVLIDAALLSVFGDWRE